MQERIQPTSSEEGGRILFDPSTHPRPPCLLYVHVRVRVCATDTQYRKGDLADEMVLLEVGEISIGFSDHR